MTRTKTGAGKRVNAPEGGKAIWIAPTPTVANFISQKKALDDLIASEPTYQSIGLVTVLFRVLEWNYRHQGKGTWHKNSNGLRW